MALSRESIVTLVPCAIMLCLTSWVMMLDSGFNRMSSDGSIDWDEGGHGEEVSHATYARMDCFTRFS